MLNFTNIDNLTGIMHFQFKQTVSFLLNMNGIAVNQQQNVEESIDLCQSYSKSRVAFRYGLQPPGL